MKKNLFLFSITLLLLPACSHIMPTMQDLKIRAVELKVNELEEEVKELQEELQYANQRVLRSQAQQGTSEQAESSQVVFPKQYTGQNTQQVNTQRNAPSSQPKQSAAKEALASLQGQEEKFPLPPANSGQQVATHIPPKKVERVTVPPKKVERVAIEKKSAVDKVVTKAGPEAAYKVALNLYRSGKYDDAKEAFRLFLKNFPSSSYVVNALYWLGECDYAKHDYTNAIFAFKDVLARFPQSSKTADALLKTALAYEKLGDASNSALHVSVLFEDWPSSEASQTARKLNLKPL